MNYKIEAPTDTNSMIGQLRDTERRVRIVLGVGYTSDLGVAEWALERGYAVTEVDAVPQDHLDRVARLDAWPQPLIRTSPADGADPDQKYRFTGPDGVTQYDIRDVINGTITYDNRADIVRTTHRS